MNDNPAGFGPGEPDENVEKLEVVMKWGHSKNFSS